MGYDANERQLREQFRNQALGLLRAEKRVQKKCLHMQGGEMGYFQKYPDAFCFLQLPTGEVVGCCLYCRKMISSIDPEDRQLFTEAFKGTNASGIAKAGQLLKEDDNQLFGQLSRFTPEDRTRILKQIISDLKSRVTKLETKDWIPVDLKSGPAQDTVVYQATPDYYEMEMEDLKVLAQQQVDKLLKRY